MTIPELTSRLNLLDVAPHLGIEARRPFHADQTPSLQVSETVQQHHPLDQG